MMHSLTACLTVADPTTLTIYPGETITIPAVVVGQDFGTTMGVLTAEFLPAPYTTCSIDMEKGQWSRILNNRKCESLKFTIYANTETCEAVLVLKTEVLRPMTIDDNHKINRTWVPNSLLISCLTSLRMMRVVFLIITQYGSTVYIGMAMGGSAL